MNEEKFTLFIPNKIFKKFVFNLVLHYLGDHRLCLICILVTWPTVKIGKSLCFHALSTKLIIITMQNGCLQQTTVISNRGENILSNASSTSQDNRDQGYKKPYQRKSLSSLGPSCPITANNRRTCEVPMVLPEPYFSLSDSWDTSCAIRFFSEPVPQLRDSWDNTWCYRKPRRYRFPPCKASNLIANNML